MKDSSRDRSAQPGRLFGAVVLVGAMVGIAPGALRAQTDWPDRLGGLLDASRVTMDVAASGLVGAGGDFLQHELAAADFFLIGEHHLTEEIAELSRHLVGAARDSGYTAFAIETGPLSAALVASLAAAGDPMAAFASHNARYPFSLPFFDTRAEAQVAIDAVAAGLDIWGLDQEFIGSSAYFLERLLELAPNDDARTLAQSWIAREAAALRVFFESRDLSGAFLQQVTEADLARLDEAFAGQAAAQEILTELAESAGIYQHFRDAEYFENNHRRIRWMKHHLTDYLDASVARPRVLMKFGTAHTGRGYSPFYQLDLGNQAAALASARHGESFHLVAYGRSWVDGDGAESDLSESAPAYSLMFDRLAPAGWTVFDLRTLRPALSARSLPEEFWPLRELAFRHDAVALRETLTSAARF